MMTHEARLQAFEDYIQSGGKIEPDDWMPDEYRTAIEKIVGFHALGEIGGFPIVQGLTLAAPSLKRKLIANAFVQDELGHGQAVLRVWQGLGHDLGTILERFERGELKLLNLFLNRFHGWADYTIFGMIADSLELDRLGALTECSYGPYARALVKIVREEGFHFRQSCDAVRVIMTEGTPAQKEAIQQSINRWWPEIMLAYGPSETKDESDRPIVRWKIKIRSNDALRQKFLNRTVPLLREWSLDIPDPNVAYDEDAKRWRYTEPDWDRLRNMQDERKEVLDIYANYLRLAIANVKKDQPIIPGALWREIYGEASILPGSAPLTGAAA